MAINVMDTMVTSARHEVVTATAVMTACEWMRRWNALTSWRPVNAARQVNRITANVVTRMPPAVEVLPPPELGLPAEPMLCISVFMNVFNCHVNRAPMRGRSPWLSGPATCATSSRRGRSAGV